MEFPEVQESFKLKKVAVSDDIIAETPKNLIEEAEPEDENSEIPEEATNEMLDSDPVKTKRIKGPRMEIVAEASALMGKWNIVAINMDFVIMDAKIETNKNDVGYIDFKKDGSFIMNIKGKQISTDDMKWGVDENINTIFQYVLSDEADAESKVEFYKIYELYENKMTLWVKPLRGYIYLEKVGKE